jgi:NitT/TauT family transport system ATP-binding protein
MTNPLLTVDQVSKTFRSETARVMAVQGVSFAMRQGEFVCLLGPSGSGKSTLLRIVGGLLPPDSGVVRFQGEPVTAPRAELGFVFQKTNLMPWRTVLQNVLLPIDLRQGHSTAADVQGAQRWLETVGLRGFEAAYPSQLSGGMNQRVALARVLLTSPQLLLLDEPFGALDALTRERLNLELVQLHENQGITTLMVTHDIEEAIFLADRVLILSERPGRLIGDVTVDLPRPRQIAQLGQPRFRELAMQVRHQLGQIA